MNNPVNAWVGDNPAEVYEQQFVPALFAPWGPVISNHAAVGPGQRVLDVACGTGVLAIAAAARAGEKGKVTGLDASPQMLDIARRKRPDLDWREGMAEALPFPDDHFDAVVSQFGLMLFEDPAQALREMWRVLRPDGRLAVAVCDEVGHSPGYAILASLLQELFGRSVADAFCRPFSLGNETKLATLCEQAGIRGARIVRECGTVRFESIDALVSTERACAWTLGGLLDDAQFERLRIAAASAFAACVAADGRLHFDMPALIIRADGERSG